MAYEHGPIYLTKYESTHHMHLTENNAKHEIKIDKKSQLFL